tara:strand:- start:1897 stop:2061 length:165 start_codon:yes stop_codon:yes gene_type:complete
MSYTDLSVLVRMMRAIASDNNKKSAKHSQRIFIFFSSDVLRLIDSIAGNSVVEA